MNGVSYEEIAERIEAWNSLRFKDTPHIMALLGYETQNHGRLGVACRKSPDRHWQSVPSFYSANDAELWIDKVAGRFSSINDMSDGTWEVCYNAQRRGTGRSKRLGGAMWAAFVRATGEE